MAHEGKKASGTYGRSSMDLQGLFGDQRQRVAPGLFNDMDRAYRAKYLKMHEVTARDQAYHFFYLWDNPEFRKARLNPIRRLWQAPGEAFERALRPMMGLKYAFITKWMVSKGLWALGAVWATSYYMLYNSGTWQHQGGWKIHVSKPMTGPNNPHFPKPDPKFERHVASDYFDQSFKADAAAAAMKPSLPVTW